MCSSLALSMFKLMNKHHCHPSPELCTQWRTTPHSLPPLNSCQPSFYFLSLWTWLLTYSTSYRWHQCLLFCDGLFSLSITLSRLIQVGARVGISFLFKADEYFIVYPLVVQLVKNPPAMWEIWIGSLGWEDPLEKGKATHSSFLA